MTTGVARRLTLRQRLVALVALSVVPALAALVYFILTIHQAREEEVRGQALRTSELAALEIDRIVTGTDGILKTLSIAPPVADLGPGCAAFLARESAQLPQLLGFIVADATGKVVCASGVGYPEAGVSDESWFVQAMAADGLAVGLYTRPPGPGRSAYLPVALSIGDGADRRVIATAVDLAWLGTLLRERNPTPGSSLAVADQSGTIIAREPEPERFVGTRVSDEFMPLVEDDRPGTALLTSRDGIRRIFGYQPPAATGRGLFVSAGYSMEASFAPIYASTWRSLALAGGGALAAFGVAWWVGDRLFRRPVHRILATIASWRAGDETVRSALPEDGTELARLAGSIDEYMDSLAQAAAERAQAEEHRTLLLGEMNHRIKNILATIQAIANQTFKGEASAESKALFASRLHAMAAAHDLLVSRNWESADMRATLEAALGPFGLDREGRFTLHGPTLRLTAKAALAFSMALHELCTNAAKYGALSCPGGRIDVAWSLGPDGRFHFRWVETGGPEVVPPQRRGFGTRLIESALAGEMTATAELSFDEAGVRFTLDADAAGLVASA